MFYNIFFLIRTFLHLHITEQNRTVLNHTMQFLGLDVGSSSVKASVIDGESGKCLASEFFPKTEMNITAIKAGWAEQHPDLWWDNMKQAIKAVLATDGIEKDNIGGIGISYQMHGLVCVDKAGQVLRPSIIWCDSRAVAIGDKAFKELGDQQCLSHLLNSPGNFTASKLKWVKENEPELFEQIDKIMLPGDYIAYRLTGEMSTTISGLSEGMFWDFEQKSLAGFLFDYYGISKDLIPTIYPTFSEQGKVTENIAAELGLKAGTPVAYRAGDQPNNALSLNVLNPGEIAATGGTSGVVYGVSDEIKYDPLSRVNTFAHVNHGEENRLGVLLCINGTGILNSWLKKNMAGTSISYEGMNELAMATPPGANGLSVLPFGNGAERVLSNKETGATINGLNFNIHSQGHVFRAAQEGIVYSFKYGIDVMKETGIESSMIRAGKANLFLSPLFREALSCVTGSQIQLYNTDGAQGAARGAALGTGYYQSFNEAFSGLEVLETIDPDLSKTEAYTEAYQTWLQTLTSQLKA